jgi:hypothetical protein
MIFSAFWRHLGDFGRHFGPHWVPKGVPKSHIFAENQHKMRKNEIQEGVWKNMKF